MTSDLREVAKMIKRREKFKRDNQLFFVRLNRPQRKLMDASSDARKDLMPRRLLFVGPNKVGKQLFDFTRIFTQTGYKLIKDLSVGDLVFSADGSVTPVVGVYPQGMQPMYKVRFKDGTSVKAGPEHLWTVRKAWSRDKWETVSTEQLVSAGVEYKHKNGWNIRKFSIPLCGALEYPSTELGISPYVLGLLLGDGSIRKNGSVELGISSKDVVDTIQALGYSYSPKLRKDLKLWMGSVTGIADKIRALNLNGCNAWSKFIPRQYLYASIPDRIHLLRGLMDTDGCCHKEEVIYITVSPRLAKGVRWIVHSLGGRCSIRRIRTQWKYKEVMKYSSAFRLQIAMPHICPFLDPRKRKLFKKIRLQSTVRTITSIERIGEGPCTCISVGHPSGLYVAQNGIVTHNTAGGVLRGICLALGEHPFLPDSHPLRHIPNWALPNVGLVVGEQLTQAIDKKLVPEYLRWIPKICRPETKKNAQGVIVRITINNDLAGKPLGSIIHMRSMDMEASTFEGIDQNWLHWDEPPPYKIFVSAERGLLPTDGVSYMTFTSLKEPWIKDFADASIDYGGKDRSIRVVEAGDIWQNSIRNGGFLTDEAIAEFVKIVPREEYDARVLGKWMSSGSVIYSSFQDSDPYVLPTFDVPRHWTRIEAVDPHDAKPTKWLFAAVAPQDITVDDEVVDRIFVIDYLNLHSSMTIVEMAKAVKQKRLDLGYMDKGPYVVLLDAKYGRKHNVTMSVEEPVNWEEKLEEVNIGYIQLSYSKPGAVELGHKTVRAYLRPQFFKLAEKDVPGIVFLDRCRGLDGPIESMRKYRYKMGADTPEEEHKDWADTVRYLCLYKPKYTEFDHDKQEFKARDKHAGR